MKPKATKATYPLNLNLCLPLVKEPISVNAVTNPKDVFDLLQEIGSIAQETFWVIPTNTKHKPLDKIMVSMGIADACIVHPREVFRPAILANASAIIVAHNHPSGDPTPSAEDIRITKQLVESGKILSIEVLDHIIIGRQDDSRPRPYFSLRGAGMVSFD